MLPQMFASLTEFVREKVPEGIDSREFDKEHLRSHVWHILYPQPAALAEEKKNG